MSRRSIISLTQKIIERSNKKIQSTSLACTLSTLPDSVKRVGVTDAFPNEYPGQVYAFNWALNREGVTPLKKSAFRIIKPLDLKIAGLEQPKKNPLKVRLNTISSIFFDMRSV